MATETIVQEALTLPPADRLAIIDRLWASLAMDPSALPLSREQEQQLDRRAAEMRQEPALGSSWQDVKARVWPKL